MVPHALPLSNAALIAANVIGYGLLVLIAIVLWLSSRKHRQPEQLLGLKIIGYLLLAEFTFNLNTWPDSSWICNRISFDEKSRDKPID